jgi:peptide/nickel transport system substrate-binding protein
MRRLDRRAIFTSGAAAALLAASGVSLQAAPRRGGSLRIALPRDGSFDLVARAATAETVTEIGPDGVLRGALASGWTSGPDARDWRFDLVPAARVEPDAVARAIMDLPDVAHAAPLGADAVRVTLVSGDAQFPYRLAHPQAGIADAGPYIARDLRPGRHLVADRVAGHHRGDRAGWVDRLEVLVIPDAKVRTEALRDGYVDVAVAPDRVGLKPAGRWRLHPSPEAMTLAAAQTVGIPPIVGASLPLDDARIGERWWRL